MIAHICINKTDQITFESALELCPHLIFKIRTSERFKDSLFYDIDYLDAADLFDLGWNYKRLKG